MKALYRTIWVLSFGGFLFDDDLQRNLFYAFVLLQFNYLNNFAIQIEDGLQDLDGSAVSRAGLYGRHGNGLYENIRTRRAQDDGMTEARRILGPTEDHCHDSASRPGCIELAEIGWMPISQMVKIGDASCYSNCLCTIEYR